MMGPGMMGGGMGGIGNLLGLGGLNSIFSFLLVIVIIVGIIFLIKYLMNQPSNYPQKTDSNAEDPLQILKIRYAKGEITKKEFERMKKDLMS